MFKKIFLLFICTLVIGAGSVYSAPRDPKPQLKPLKIEEKNYKYGNLEKTLRNPASENYDSYADDENSRKTIGVLDIINTVMLVILCIIGVLFILTKINGTPFTKLFLKKKNDNKFSILSAKQLGNGKTVYLLEVNARQIIVGTTESKVDSIMPLDKSFSTEEIPAEYIEKLFNDVPDEFKRLEE